MIDETAEEIADMQTHSSSVVAVKAARALRSLAEQDAPSVDEYCRSLERNSRALRRANPSHASLHNTQEEIVSAVMEADPASVEEAQSLTREAASGVVRRVEEGKDRAAAAAADFLAEEETLLTHDYSTTVLSAITRAVEEGGEFTVYVMEARPRYLGRKMARRLAALESVDTRLMVDNTHGHVMPEIDRVVVGMDCIVEDTLYNRVGTYPLATTAADRDVPITVLGSAAKIVNGGFAFRNEERAKSEVMLEPAEGFDIVNPAYDATPTRLLDTLVTDEGITEF
ncbi:MAG: translation initiation factor eIF-2B [Haloarculaceae archaeon]